ncbi:MAG TPA: right-handed parallel beta-helix repeat-containing protein [Actinomycetota bacterium]|nr:right-handed parallel beta-helix repeat-containing protein [Actinomycetota bacterium]
MTERRRSTNRRSAVLLVVALLGVLAGPAKAQSKPLVVDKDRAQCPNADFTSIQQAVAAAAPNDEIHVCPDLYTESVTIDKPVKLRGRLGAVQAENCFTPAQASDPTRQAIVDGGDHSFRLAANDILLEGFVVEGATRGIDSSDGFSGYLIRHNLIQRNSLDGVDLHSGGATTTRAHHNCFRENARGALVSERGNLHNALIDHNQSFRNGEGLALVGPGSRTAVRLEHNVSHEDRLVGFAMQNSQESTVAHNKATALPPAPGQFNFPIVIGGGNLALQISHNDVEGGGSGILFSLAVFLARFPSSTDLEVRGNTVRGAQVDGIRLAGNAVHNSSFIDNQTMDNGRDGISLGAQNTSNRFERNHARDNRRDGIRVGTGVSGNTFEGNQLRGNGEHDAHDDSRLANVWVNNHCKTDFPAGTICVP